MDRQETSFEIRGHGSRDVLKADWWTRINSVAVRRTSEWNERRKM